MRTQIDRVKSYRKSVGGKQNSHKFLLHVITKKAIMNYSALDGREEVYEKDMEELDKCRNLLLLSLTFEHQTIDPGTAYELGGVATMLKKPMIIVQRRDGTLQT